MRAIGLALLTFPAYARSIAIETHTSVASFSGRPGSTHQSAVSPRNTSLILQTRTADFASAAPQASPNISAVDNSLPDVAWAECGIGGGFNNQTSPCVAFCNPSDTTCFQAARDIAATCKPLWQDYIKKRHGGRNLGPGWSTVTSTSTHMGTPSTSTVEAWTSFSLANESFIVGIPTGPYGKVRTITPVYALGSPVLSTSAFTPSNWTTTMAIVTAPTPDCKYTDVYTALSPWKTECGQCTLTGGTVELYYWPETTAAVTHGLESAVLHGVIMYSPSVYISFQTVYAQNSCSQIGNMHTGTMLAMRPQDVSTQVHWGGMVFQSGANQYGTINYADLSGLPPAGAYESQPSCIMFGCSTIYPSSWKPTLVVPSKLRALDPAWSACAVGLEGLYDPPVALTPVSAMATVTVPSYSAPSATPEPTATTDSPQQTYGSTTTEALATLGVAQSLAGILVSAEGTDPRTQLSTQASFISSPKILPVTPTPSSASVVSIATSLGASSLASSSITKDVESSRTGHVSSSMAEETAASTTLSKIISSMLPYIAPADGTSMPSVTPSNGILADPGQHTVSWYQSTRAQSETLSGSEIASSLTSSANALSVLAAALSTASKSGEGIYPVSSTAANVGSALSFTLQRGGIVSASGGSSTALGQETATITTRTMPNTALSAVSESVTMSASSNALGAGSTNPPSDTIESVTSSARSQPDSVSELDSGTFVVDGKTLDAGTAVTLTDEGSRLTVSMFISDSATFVALGKSTAVQLGPFGLSSTSASVITLDSITLTEKASGAFLVDGATLEAGEGVTVGTGSSKTTLSIINVGATPAVIFGTTATKALVTPSLSAAPKLPKVTTAASGLSTGGRSASTWTGADASAAQTSRASNGVRRASNGLLLVSLCVGGNKMKLAGGFKGHFSTVD